MTQLPVDIWWIILKKFWEDVSSYKFYPYKHRNNANAFPSLSVSSSEKICMGDWITLDLFVMRSLCKTTKKMVDKYSKRYINHHIGDESIHRLIFPYG